MTERVLAIVAHPDDETLGCGATLAKHHLRGDVLAIVAMADGVKSRVYGGTGALLKMTRERHLAYRKACRILGTEDVWIHQYPDNQMDKGPLLQVVKHIEKHIARFKPTIVYTHHGSDVNVDHRVVHEAVVTACRPQPGGQIERLMFFEVPSSTEYQVPGKPAFQPNHFEDVAETMQVKLDAMACYATELREPPHPRSLSGIKNLAQYRGSSVGLSAAEAFVIGRGIS